MLVTASSSERAIAVDDLAEIVREVAPDTSVDDYDTPSEAIAAARAWAAKAPRRGVVITGSITLIGDALVLAAAEGWKR